MLAFEILSVPEALEFIKERSKEYACMNPITPVRQFWKPSAWADALGFHTRYKRWLAACYPLVGTAFVGASLKRLQAEIRDRCLEELFWSGARLDLWVLALYMLLSFPISSWVSVRYNAADASGVPKNRLSGERKKMFALLRQTLAAGHTLSNYLKGTAAQAQQTYSASLNMSTLPALGEQALEQDSPVPEALLSESPRSASASMHDADVPDSSTSTSGSMHAMKVSEEEASAAYDLHTIIVRNLTARLSLSARILHGVVLTQPWEVLEAFYQVDQPKDVGARSLEYIHKPFSEVWGAWVYVKIKNINWAARHPRTPAQQFWRPSAWADAMYAYGREWPMYPVFWLELMAMSGMFITPYAAFNYLEVLHLCSRLAAGSWVAWLSVSIALVAFAFLARWISIKVVARRKDNLRPYTEEEDGHAFRVSSLATLCADIRELEDARGEVQSLVHDQLSSEVQPHAPVNAAYLLVLNHHATITRSGTSLPQLSKLQLLLIMKACVEMIANLRSRLAAACHKVTGLWLTDITEAREAMLHKLKRL